MNLKELTEKVVGDSSENPFLTQDELNDLVKESNDKDESIKSKDDEIAKLKEELESRNKEYNSLKDRVVDSVLSGKNIKEDEDKTEPKKEEKKEVKPLQDLIKREYLKEY